MSKSTATLGRVAIIKQSGDSYDIYDSCGTFFIPNLTYSELEGLYYQLQEQLQLKGGNGVVNSNSL